MGAISVESVRALVRSATVVEEHRRLERDSDGSYGVVDLIRPGFDNLRKFARQNCLVLAAVFPLLDSQAERLIASEVLSECVDVELAPFWEELAADPGDELEFVATAVIGMARLGKLDFVERMHALHVQCASDRLVFHLGIARLLIGDWKGVDCMIEVLDRESRRVMLKEGDAAEPLVGTLVMHLLRKLFLRGSLEESSDWIGWWQMHRATKLGRKMPVARFASFDLSYVPLRTLRS